MVCWVNSDIEIYIMFVKLPNCQPQGLQIVVM
jgi:hypothetical protein